VTRQEFLREVHRAYRPRAYLEIGIAAGRSLSLSRTRTIAVDPAFKITSEIQCDVQVVKATSDDFFARDDRLAHFPHGRIDLGFIDGSHLLEFVLRDFINVERHSHWASVIVVDDVLPRSVAEASRDRSTKAWAGDVFKLPEVLGIYRPDLLLFSLDTDPTGVLLVLGADPRNRVLAAHYDEIIAKYVHPDPQRVPPAVLRRETAIDPASIVHSGVWSDLRNAREFGLAREAGWGEVRRSAAAAARPAERRHRPRGPAKPGPGKKAKAKRDAKTGPPPISPGRALTGVRRRLRNLRRQR
jgi:hypothetical protein